MTNIKIYAYLSSQFHCFSTILDLIGEMKTDEELCNFESERYKATTFIPFEFLFFHLLAILK